MKRWSFLASAIALSALIASGCSTLDERQREWIFQPSDRSWGNTEAKSDQCFMRVDRAGGSAESSMAMPRNVRAQPQDDSGNP